MPARKLKLNTRLRSLDRILAGMLAGDGALACEVSVCKDAGKPSESMVKFTVATNDMDWAPAQGPPCIAHPGARSQIGKALAGGALGVIVRVHRVAATNVVVGFASCEGAVTLERLDQQTNEECNTHCACCGDFVGAEAGIVYEPYFQTRRHNKTLCV